MKRITWQVGAIGIGVVTLFSGAAVFLNGQRDQSFVPAAIREQLTTSIIEPKSQLVRVDQSSVKYDEPQKLLTFTASYHTTSLIITEQPLPQEFVDVPQSFDKFAADAGQYDQFDSVLGSVRLTRLPKQTNQQAAIIKTSVGIMMFIKPDSSLNTDEWRQLIALMGLET